MIAAAKAKAAATDQPYEHPEVVVRKSERRAEQRARERERKERDEDMRAEQVERAERDEEMRAVQEERAERDEEGRAEQGRSQAEQHGEQMLEDTDLGSALDEALWAEFRAIEEIDTLRQEMDTMRREEERLRHEMHMMRQDMVNEQSALREASSGEYEEIQ